MLVMRVIILSTTGIVNDSDSLCMHVGVSPMIVLLIMIMPFTLIVYDHCSSRIRASAGTT